MQGSLGFIWKAKLILAAVLYGRQRSSKSELLWQLDMAISMIKLSTCYLVCVKEHLSQVSLSYTQKKLVLAQDTRINLLAKKEEANKLSLNLEYCHLCTLFF